MTKINPVTEIQGVPGDSSRYLNGAGGYTVPSGVPPSGAANLIYATPNGSSGSASLRALVTADLPNPIDGGTF